jgi:alanyl-tRNA synthetase
MTSSEIRQAFLDFFASKGHEIVPSAPIVVKNDPTLMFTNAGMNQFKDIFLGNQPARFRRIANTQKCLRVSGKHNDLEEVGVDTYHHTMFEMLGNWSFGDYFKKEAIEWAWQLLTDVYKLPKDRLYVTVFEGDEKEGLTFDQESYDHWKKRIAEDRILKGNKKDNFWEMGDTGPCGPCTEIHIDLRSEAERAGQDGKELVNAGHPQVIEIWNNVFMEFNRLSDGSLVKLPAQHVDTGMGFERLCMAMQGKQSNYDTDIFQPSIQFISKHSGISYGSSEKTDIAMRVMADHIRAIAFAIADGQLPSNTGAGYVIRRILRRAVRYAYTFLGFREPFLARLVPLLSEQFRSVFPELTEQKGFVEKVIQEEENSFLRTLSAGIQRFESRIKELGKGGSKKIDGEFAFELYDTYGFPIDLTQLLAREEGFSVEMDRFEQCMSEQKKRSRAASAIDTEDWVVLKDVEKVEFLGYDRMEAEVSIVKYRRIKSKGREQYQLVFDQTPFYAESGGQVGDTGTIRSANEEIPITDTKKENNLIVHFADSLPENTGGVFIARVDVYRRELISSNHSATHLMHSALRSVLGTHVGQKGSLVNEDYTRFDFSHFSKVTDEQIREIENIVNEKVRENIRLEELRNVPLEEALRLGATALFGEKYGETVRVIAFDRKFSMELCGGTHVPSTGQIGLFKIVSESAVAAGVRRIEAITSEKALQYINSQLDTLSALREIFNNPKDLVKAAEAVMEERAALSSKINALLNERAKSYKTELIRKTRENKGINIIAEKIDLPSAEAIKNLAFDLRNNVDNLFLVLGAELEGKAHLTVMLSDNLVTEKNLNAGNIVRELAKEVQGGGGGQPFYATAGGKDPAGLSRAIQKVDALI